MRILFAPLPGVSHAFPMVPLGWALKLAGHEVVMAAAGEALVAKNAGLTVVNASPGVTMRGLAARLADDRPELVRKMRETSNEHRTACRWLAHVSSYLTDGLIAVAEWYQPDIVVYSPFNIAALIASREVRAAAIDLRSNIASDDDATEILHEELGDLLDQRIARGGLYPELTLDTVPTSVREAADGSVQMRPVPYNGGGLVPEWLRRSAERPRVVVTTGTVKFGGLETMQQVIASVGDLSQDFLLTVDDGERDKLGELPSNVRTVGWVPLTTLLRNASAIVHHGGASTAMSAMAAGVPQLIVPEGIGQHVTAQALHERGVALVKSRDQLDATCFARLTCLPELGETAFAVAQEIQDMPEPYTAVPELLKVAG